MLAFGALLALSPLVTAEAVGRLPLFNLLGLSYLLPGLLLALIAAAPGLVLHREARVAASAGSGILVFVYLSLETRRLFQGPVLTWGPLTTPGNAELYAYSVVWIAFALALLALGIWRGSKMLRYASLAILMIATAKVFLFDMSDLTGLYRVASFLGLGLALISIGRVYQRYVFPEPPSGEPQPDV